VGEEDGQHRLPFARAGEEVAGFVKAAMMGFTPKGNSLVRFTDARPQRVQCCRVPYFRAVLIAR
jgi:hypothetical protein